MALESPVTYISDLVSTNPTTSDPRNEGDDHIRNIKAAIKATFPNVSGAVLPTHTELNYVDGVTSAIQTQLDAKADLTGDTFTGQVVASYTASYAIDVNGSSNGYVGLRAINTNAGSSAYSYLQLGNDTNGAAAALELGSGANTGFGSIGANALVLRNGLTAPLGFGTGGSLRMSISGAGNVTINTPSSGTALTVNSVAGGVGLWVEGAAASGAFAQINGVAAQLRAYAISTSGALRWRLGANSTAEGGSDSGSNFFIERFSDAGASLGTAISITRSTGAVTINAPSSGNTLTLAGTNALAFSGTSAQIVGPPTSLVFRNNANSATNFTLTDGGTATLAGNLTINAGGITVTGTSSVNGSFTASSYVTAIPVAGITSGTLTTSQRGQCVDASGGVTVPASTFAAGDTVSIYNNTASSITITQGASLTMRQVGTTNTGNRTLAAYGFCTIWFRSATECVISGGGLT